MQAKLFGGRLLGGKLLGGWLVGSFLSMLPAAAQEFEVLPPPLEEAVREAPAEAVPSRQRPPAGAAASVPFSVLEANPLRGTPGFAAGSPQGWSPVRPAPPHLVLREHAPPQLPAVIDGQAVVQDPVAAKREQHLENLRTLHGLKKEIAYVNGRRAPVPEAATELRQKTPYSYGYFGAAEQKHWALHFGSRQNFTRWSRR